MTLKKVGIPQNCDTCTNIMCALRDTDKAVEPCPYWQSN